MLSRIKRLLVLAVSLPLLALLFSYRLLDPKAKEKHSIIRGIASSLHELNIDVLQDWKSDVIIDNARPVVAPLTNWPVADGSFTSGWTSDFRKGFQSGYAVVKGNSKAKNIDLPTIWKNTKKDQRIFISFTNADNKIAQQVRIVLEKKGYIVFAYLNENGRINQSAEDVGRIMSTAGQHLVIDTRNARLSQGVIAEALMHSNYQLKLPIVELRRGKRIATNESKEYRARIIDYLTQMGVPITVAADGKQETYYVSTQQIGLGDRLGPYFDIRINGQDISGTHTELVKWTHYLEQKLNTMRKQGTIQKTAPPDVTDRSSRRFFIEFPKFNPAPPEYRKGGKSEDPNKRESKERPRQKPFHR